MPHPNALPHDPIKRIADNLYVVYGSVQLLPIAKITRNMTIVRSNGELTLINSVRLDEAGLAELDALGEVKHVLRLGPLHGMDDAFYLDRYNARFWSYGDGITYPEPKPTDLLDDNAELPFPNARLITFKHLKETEGVILLNQDNGILLACDAIQSYSTPPHMPHTAWLTRRLLPLAGFPEKTIIGPIWIKLQAEDSEATREELRALQTLPFDQLICGHGTFLEANAAQEYADAFQRVYG